MCINTIEGGGIAIFLSLPLFYFIFTILERDLGNGTMTRGRMCELEFYKLAGVRDDRVMLYIL